MRLADIQRPTPEPMVQTRSGAASSRRMLGIDVLAAARGRISAALDESSRAYVSFSGGKDSTVMLHLVMEEAIRRGRQIGVLVVDLEAQYQHTIAHIGRCLDLYAEHVDPYWVALPLNLRNAVSQYEPQWQCWDPDRRESWVRNPPSPAITDEGRWGWFRRGMEFEDFVPKFADWYAGGDDAVCFVGIRCQESLNRWRTIASTTKQRVNGWPWSTRKGRAWNAYPLYDWTTEDLWTWHARHPDAPRNEVYDLMHRAGLTIHQARLCQPYGDDQRRGLWLYHVLEPETWGRVVARVNGANQGALYARDTGNILGVGKVTLPDGHTWQGYAGLLLESMPEQAAEHYRTKIGVFLSWWEGRGFQRGIPDEADPALEAAKKTPSWRRICRTLLRNDYWCKGLSFTQQKDGTSYARYRALMRNRGSHSWEYQCGPDLPGRPTAKQLAMLASQAEGRTPSCGWRALGEFLGRDARAAKREATRRDASRAIDQLHASFREDPPKGEDHG